MLIIFNGENIISMSKTLQNLAYITSNEAKKVLQVSDCNLAHLKMEGKLPNVKKGNEYLFDFDSFNFKQLDKIKI